MAKDRQHTGLYTPILSIRSFYLHLLWGMLFDILALEVWHGLISPVPFVPILWSLSAIFAFIPFRFGYPVFI